MTKTLKMVFQLPGDKTHTINLADPAEGLSKDEAEGVMSSIVSTQAILVGGAHPESYLDAYIHMQDDIELE